MILAFPARALGPGPGVGSDMVASQLADSDQQTNIRVIAPSRRRLHAGDLFAVRPADLGYLFGRVINVDTRIGGFPGDVILAYIYRPLFDGLDPPGPGALGPHELLIPPFGINRLPWSRGYFFTVAHRPLAPGDVLPRHVFHRTTPIRDDYLDEHGVAVVDPRPPIGEWGLNSYRTIDDDISLALGLPLAPGSDRIVPGK